MMEKQLWEMVDDMDPRERIIFQSSHGNYNLETFDRVWLENALLDYWEGTSPSYETIKDYDDCWEAEKDRLSHLDDEMLVYEGGDSGVFL